MSYFARRTYDADAAIDLTAETFAAAFVARDTFRGTGEDQAAGWLYGIARNQLSLWYRQGAVERRALRRLGVERRELTDDEHQRIEELGELDQLRARVAELLDALPADARVAVRLRVVGEHSYREVAAALGITETAARARVSRALRTLGDELADDGRLEEPSRG